MICSGNICRSPLAECVLRHKAVERGVKDHLVIDSAGVGGWHVGEAPDHRVCEIARRNNISMTGTARQITRHDLTRFDLLVCMDRTHREHVLGMGADPNKVRMLLEFAAAAARKDEGDIDVPDPYYGAAEGFESVYRMIDSACGQLLRHVLDGRTGASGNHDSRT
jgi:protein-tyrosine phosphatase